MSAGEDRLNITFTAKRAAISAEGFKPDQKDGKVINLVLSRPSA